MEMYKVRKGIRDPEETTTAYCIAWIRNPAVFGEVNVKTRGFLPPPRDRFSLKYYIGFCLKKSVS